MDKQVVKAPRRRREHSAELKRELVARSLEPGVSVAAIAMNNGINANLLFGWRRRHLESLAQPEPAPRRSPAAVLLPVSFWWLQLWSSTARAWPGEMPASCLSPPSADGRLPVLANGRSGAVQFESLRGGAIASSRGGSSTSMTAP